jgi:rod shape-determining protein MreC
VYRKQVRRRRAVLVLLVVVSLVLLSTHFSEGSDGPLHTFQRAVANALGPIEEGADRALKPARDLLNWIDETFAARGANDELEAEVQELRERLAAAESALGENRELRELLELGPGGGAEGFKAVTARVIGRSPTVWYSTVQVDRGSSSGVRASDPVVTGDGLVGRVTEVTAGTAQVTLISDHTSAASAKVLPDGPSGVVEPEVGDPEDLLLDFIEDDREVEEGSMVVTAGWRAGKLGSLYPYGIPIGRVTEASIGEQETYQRVHVRPFADLREFEYVEVLTRGGSVADSQTAATGEETGS